MKFATLSPDKLPATRAFGGQKKYEDADIKDAAAILARGEAISDGIDYDTPSKARNAAGTLRSRLKTDFPKLEASVTAVTTDGKSRFWIVPKIKK